MRNWKLLTIMHGWIDRMLIGSTITNSTEESYSWQSHSLCCAYHKDIELIQEIERHVNSIPNSHDERNCGVWTFSPWQGYGIYCRVLFLRWTYSHFQCLVLVIYLDSTLQSNCLRKQHTEERPQIPTTVEDCLWGTINTRSIQKMKFCWKDFFFMITTF